MNIPDPDPFLDLLHIKAWLFNKKRLFLFPGAAGSPCVPSVAYRHLPAGSSASREDEEMTRMAQSLGQKNSG